MKTSFTCLLLSLLFLSQSYAQKYGHVNSNEIIMSLQEVKSADSEIQAYSNQLIQKGQQMVKDYEGLYQAYLGKANSGELSQVAMQQEENLLRQKQQEIASFEREVQELIAKKKQEKYQPILDKIQVIIDEIGKEMGYTMIFDSFSMGMVFANESEDIMPLVKERLGIQ